MSDDYDAVIGVDFGSGGYAVAVGYFNDGYSDPANLYVRVLQCREKGRQKDTIALLCRRPCEGSEELEGVEIGIEAERKYADLDEDGRHSYVLFLSYKMKLYGSGKESTSAEGGPMAEAVDGFQFSAKAVITEALKIICKMALETVNKSRGGGIGKTDGILWVLTVPAIWTQQAKQVMRSAAVASGVPEKALKLALEPEAASLACRYGMESRIRSRVQADKVGDQYMVIDAGAGTVDISALRVKPDHKLEEVVPPTGGVCGSQKVDVAFEDLLSFKVFVNNPPCINTLIDSLKEDSPHEWLETCQNFEAQKVKATADAVMKVKMGKQLLRRYTKSQKDDPRVLKEGIEMCVEYGCLKLQPNIVKTDLFEETVAEVVMLVEEMLGNMGGCRRVYLVGGFAACPFLVEAVQDVAKAWDAELILPTNPQVSVVEGAVIYGLRPDALDSRVMPATIACEVSVPWTEAMDLPEHAETRMVGDTMMVTNALDVLVKRGERVSTTDVRRRSYRALREVQEISTVRLYTVSSDSAQVTTDFGVDLVGELFVATTESPSLTVSLRFGGTEMEAEVASANGAPLACKLRFARSGHASLVPLKKSCSGGGLAGAASGVITADIAFVMDCTGSMQVWLDAAQTQLIGIARSVQEVLAKRDELVQLRFAFVAYKDFCDDVRLQALDFTTDVDTVIEFIRKQVADGGGDGPEDLLGGLNRASELSWSSQNRFLVLVADAPCHGEEFSGPRSGDMYPDGNPDGLTADDVFDKIAQQKCEMIFTRLTDFTDVMIGQFSTMYRIRQIDLKDIHCISQFGRSLSSQIAGNICRS